MLGQGTFKVVWGKNRKEHVALVEVGEKGEGKD